MRFLAKAYVTAAVLFSTVHAQEAPAPPTVVPQSARVAVVPGSVGQSLHVTVGQSLFFDAGVPLSRVYVDNPAVLQAYASSRQEVVLSGMAAGRGTVVVWDEQGNNTAYSLIVDLDVARLQEAYESAFPLDKILVSADQDHLFLRGYVSSDEEFTGAADLAKGFSKIVVNSLRVAPPHQRQVRLDVTFAEVDRAKSGQLGFNFLSMGNMLGLAGTGQYQAFTAPTISNGVQSETINTPLNLLLFSQKLNLGVAIQDMASKQVLQILAQPTISALSGHTETFLAGGQFPFPIVQGSMSGQVGVSVEFKPYGVSLSFTPVVLEDGSIRLHIAPEVSALDYTNSVQVQGTSIPALSSRKAETDIEIKDGQSFALTGLLDRRLTDQFDKMPGIASIPILGQLFRSKSISHSTTELLVFVSVRVVNPLIDAVPVPEPPKPALPYMTPGAFDQDLRGKK